MLYIPKVRGSRKSPTSGPRWSFWEPWQLSHKQRIRVEPTERRTRPARLAISPRPNSGHRRRRSLLSA